jgi:hypothetical protein
MQNNMNYNFRVYLISDGVCSGLLLERKRQKEPQITRAYFWLNEPNGLDPRMSPEIVAHCNEGCHKIELAKNYHNQPNKYAKYRNQELIFRELKAYTEQITTHPEIIDTPQYLVCDYSFTKKGYPTVLSRFFDRSDSELAKFLVSSKIYRECVLKNLHGKEMVIGRSQEFIYRDSRNIFPEEKLDYLFTAEEILDTKHPTSAEWFREKNLLYSDFEKGKFFIRPEVGIINQKISDKKNILLVGNGATAKTTIVRTVIYKLYENRHENIFYFDIASDRYFDRKKVIQEIRSVKGLFVIENIHLGQQNIQLIYNKFKYDPERHFLFTMRKPQDNYYNKIIKELGDIFILPLEAFAYADKLIDRFCNDPETPQIVRDKRQDIVEVSKGDLYWLTFALKECAKVQGQGEPQSWIKNHVFEYLAELENCKDPYQGQYPCILVALSPLYMNEMLTEESFLKKMGFTREALNGLVERGEVIRQTDAYDNTYYGLLHSSHAKAFWAHGKNYIINKKLWEYEEFIYDYVASGTSNAMKVLVTASEENELIGVYKDKDNQTITIEYVRLIAPRIISRLRSENKLLKFIENGKSLVLITDLIMVGLNLQSGLSEDLLNLFALKIAACKRFHDAAYCLWTTFQKSQQVGLTLSDMCIQRINSFENEGWEICDIQNLKTLCQKLKQAHLLPIASFRLLNIAKHNRNPDTKLWQFLDKNGNEIG